MGSETPRPARNSHPTEAHKATKEMPERQRQKHKRVKQVPRIYVPNSLSPENTHFGNSLRLKPTRMPGPPCGTHLPGFPSGSPAPEGRTPSYHPENANLSLSMCCPSGIVEQNEQIRGDRLDDPSARHARASGSQPLPEWALAQGYWMAEEED